MTRPPLVLINSGAYAAPELQAEFGELPPAFLPVGVQRLYELQVRALAPLGAAVVLTLPESMQLPSWDEIRLKELGVGVLRSPDGLKLGAALLHALAALGFSGRPLRLLHGDTLVRDLDLEREDVVSVASGSDGYRWGHVREQEGRLAHAAAPDEGGSDPAGLRLTGYYAFSDSGRFAEALALAGGDFFGGLNRYAAQDPGLGLVREGAWLDFGHVQTFFRSRRVVTTARAFNQLQIGETAVRKRSAQTDKLRAEARWFEEVPVPLRPYTARLLDAGVDADGFFYDTEYRSTPTLAELAVFGRLGLASWRRIFGACATFLDLATACAPPDAPADTLRPLVVDKTRARLESYGRSAGLDLDRPNTLNGRPAPSLGACVDRIARILDAEPPRPSVMHGDFCFSNILYDFRTDRIQVIDPRGLLADGAFSIHGDLRYDLAKFMHSAVGRYDLIVAGRCAAARTGPNGFTLTFPEDALRPDLEAAAAELDVGGVRLDSPAVAAATASLFLSMAPLHEDRPDRQTAFIANGLRLMLALEDAA